MAYHDINAPAAVLNREITLTRNFVAALAKKLRNVGFALPVANSAHYRFEQVEALRAKSDAELAKMGLKRDDIVTHVFRDLYYA